LAAKLEKIQEIHIDVSVSLQKTKVMMTNLGLYKNG
jgi:hypothetical protein